jgi:hypothetical protein
VFGQQEDIEYTELKLGDNQFSSQKNDFQYFKIESELPTVYKFQVEFAKGKHILAFDYFNCQGRTDYTDRPDDKTNCRIYDEDTSYPAFTVYEPGSLFIYHLNMKKPLRSI